MKMEDGKLKQQVQSRGRLLQINRYLDLDVTEVFAIIFLAIVIICIMFPDMVPGASIITAASIIILICVLAVRLASSGYPISLTLASGLWMAFTVYVLLNKGLIDSPGHTAGTWLLLFPASLVASILMAFDRVDWLSRAISIFAVLGCVNAVATIVFWLVPGLYADWFYPTFLRGTYVVSAGYRSGLTNHYSTNGMVLALGLVTCLSIALRGRSRRFRWWALFAITLFAILLTTKRAHLLFGVAACVIAYTAWNSTNGISTAGRLLLVATAVLFVLYVASLYVPEVTAVFERIASLENDETFGGRSVYYTICLELWADSPIFGSGWDGFTDALYRSGISDLSRLYSQGNLSQDAHNVFLQLLAEEGLVGVALFCAAAAASLVSTIRLLVLENRREEPDGALRAACAGSIAIQTFFVMYCVTGNPLYTYVEYVPYLLSLSVPFAIRGQRGAREGIGDGQPFPRNPSKTKAQCRMKEHASHSHAL